MQERRLIPLPCSYSAPTLRVSLWHVTQRSRASPRLPTPAPKTRCWVSNTPKSASVGHVPGSGRVRP